MKVANRKCIRRLGMRTLLAGRTRNLVAILAIVMADITADNGTAGEAAAAGAVESGTEASITANG